MFAPDIVTLVSASDNLSTSLCDTALEYTLTLSISAVIAVPPSNSAPIENGSTLCIPEDIGDVLVFPIFILSRYSAIPDSNPEPSYVATTLCQAPSLAVPVLLAICKVVAPPSIIFNLTSPFLVNTEYPLLLFARLSVFPARKLYPVSVVLNQREILNALVFVKSKVEGSDSITRDVPSKLNALPRPVFPSTKVVVPVTVPSFPPDELVSNRLSSNWSRAMSSCGDNPICCQEYVNGSFSGSVLPEPSRVTRVCSFTF